MIKYKVGDKVRIYGNYDFDKSRNCMVYLRGDVGKVIGITNVDDEIIVKVPRWGTAEVHPKQCRRILK